MSDPGVGISPQTGYRIFADDGDNTVCIVTSGYADFASKEIPAGHVAITGILSQGKTNTGRTMYLLKMRDINDVEPLKILYD